MVRLPARLIEQMPDARLERLFGSRLALRALFAVAAASFDPGSADGFEGLLVYELSRPATGRGAVRWTVAVSRDRATARPGGADRPALTVRYALSDFIRVAAGTIDPAVPLLRDRASFDGDFSLAARLPEMFRAPPGS